MKKIILCSLIALSATISISCTSTSAEKSETPPSPSMQKSMQKTTKEKIASCTCVKMWMPVCGENKKTYGNSCEADCAGVKYTSGACAEMK
ncbi:MAG: hypothetical protein K2Q18_16665 [Bdellovibrionales bacterium]|nr:hypothetical protein [Bdellovibrionales bacterium]